MSNQIKSAFKAVGSTAGGYLELMQAHAKQWQREQAIEQEVAHREHIAEVAKRMDLLAKSIAKLDKKVLTSTNKMVDQVLKDRGLK